MFDENAGNLEESKLFEDTTGGTSGVEIEGMLNPEPSQPELPPEEEEYEEEFLSNEGHEPDESTDEQKKLQEVMMQMQKELMELDAR